MRDGPTGFHLIMPLNKEVSCSSVHESETIFATSFCTGVCSTSSAGCSVRFAVKIRDGRRAFFLDAILGVRRSVAGLWCEWFPIDKRARLYRYIPKSRIPAAQPSPAAPLNHDASRS